MLNCPPPELFPGSRVTMRVVARVPPSRLTVPEPASPPPMASNPPLPLAMRTLSAIEGAAGVDLEFTGPEVADGDRVEDVHQSAVVDQERLGPGVAVADAGAEDALRVGDGDLFRR